MSYVSNDNLKAILTDTKNKIKDKINTIEVNEVKANKTITEETTIEEGYTQNADIPYVLWGGEAVAIGNNIYLLGSTHYTNTTYPYAKYNYKYDTTTDTYTQNTNIPNNFYCASAVAIGNNIYLLGGDNNQNKGKYNYKYDTTTDTYTQNRDIPNTFTNDSAVAIGTDIYLLGGYFSGDNSNNYKYNTIDNNYTKNKDIPYAFVNGSVVAVGNNIYLLGGNNSSNYKYNISDYSGKIKFKKSDHYIYTDKLKYYTSNESQLIYLDDDEIYVEYDKNNNLIKNNFTPDIDGKMNIYVRTGAKLNGKSLPGSGWQAINILDYI